MAQAALHAPPEVALHCVAGHCYYQLSVSLFFFSVFCFWPTSGNILWLKICFPQYFGMTRRCMQKKIFFEGNFYFFMKKRWFLQGQRSVSEPGPTPSPWSIFCIFFFFSTPSAFDPLRGNSRVWKFVYPNILS